MYRRNGSNFEAMCDALPEVNEHTVFDMILSHMPPQFHPRLIALKPALLPMIEQKLVEILQAKVQALLAA